MRTPEDKFVSVYRRSIFLRHKGRDFLQAVYDRPAKLRRALAMLRYMSEREFVTDDPANP